MISYFEKSVTFEIYKVTFLNMWMCRAFLIMQSTRFIVLCSFGSKFTSKVFAVHCAIKKFSAIF